MSSGLLRASASWVRQCDAGRRFSGSPRPTQRARWCATRYRAQPSCHVCLKRQIHLNLPVVWFSPVHCCQIKPGSHNIQTETSKPVTHLYGLICNTGSVPELFRLQSRTRSLYTIQANNGSMTCSWVLRYWSKRTNIMADTNIILETLRQWAVNTKPSSPSYQPGPSSNPHHQ